MDVAYPVLLFPLIPKSEKPFLTLVMVQDLTQPSITHFDYLSVLVQAMTVKLEQSLLDKYAKICLLYCYACSLFGLEQFKAMSV